MKQENRAGNVNRNRSGMKKKRRLYLGHFSIVFRSRLELNFRDAPARQGNMALREKNQELLGLYQKGRAYHDAEKLVPGVK